MKAKPAEHWPDSGTILGRSRDLLIARWEELLRLRRDVMGSSAVEDIHDLRVASRRFRAALKTFEPLTSKPPKGLLTVRIRELTCCLGGLRNIDEALLFFQSREDTDHSKCSTLLRRLSELRPREFKRIHKELKAFEHRDLNRLVQKMVVGMDGDRIKTANRFSLVVFFSDASISRFLPIQQLLQFSTASEQGELRHSLRIAIKKWRYFVEIMAPVLDRDYSLLLELLKEYQSLLGQMNDITEFQALLGRCRVPRVERKQAQAILLAENDRLLADFNKLVEQKPLTYTFHM